MGTGAKSYLIHKPEVTLPEKVIEEVTGAGPADAVAVASLLPEPQRAALAQFCYGRRHLRHLGLTNKIGFRLSPHDGQPSRLRNAL